MPSIDQIKSEYSFLKNKGWDKICISAANSVVTCDKHIPAHIKSDDCQNPIVIFKPWDVAGTASRETGIYFWTKYPDGNIPGDHGNAVGIMQVNIQFHAHVPNLEKPEVNIPAGLLVLAQYRDQLLHKPDIDPKASYFETMVRAAYNRGVSGVYHSWLETGNPDKITANQNYGVDTLLRVAMFKPLFEADGVE